MAAIVPMGIDFWASRRSPERFEPAMMPESTKVIVKGQIYRRSHLPRQGGGVRRVLVPPCCFTCDRWEIDPDQQGEEAGDVGQDVAVRAGRGAIGIHVRRKPALLQDGPLFQVFAKQVL